MCQFIEEKEDSVVRSVGVTDILLDKTPVPYASRRAWYQIQQDCKELYKVCNHLKYGTTPGKVKGARDVKRYLGKARLSTNPSDELIIVLEVSPLQPVRQRIVVPRNIIDGLLTVMHLKLSHPSRDQMKKVFNRAFYALDLDRAIEGVTAGCHQCASLKKIPARFSQQSTSEPPDAIGLKFSADVIRRDRQKILLVREYVSSFTDATFIQSEESDSLKEGLIKILTRLHPTCGPPSIVRVDPATGFQGIQKDLLMSSLGIPLEIGEPKNINKNPVSEKAISEFHDELTRVQPEGGMINETTLAITISNLNSRVRSSGFSSIEIWTKRDMSTGDTVIIDNKELISSKQRERIKGHLPSAKYKARGKTSEKCSEVNKGDVVYLYQDRDKTKARDKYLVVRIDDDKVTLQKFLNNQLRAKRYHAKLSDIIIVQPSQQNRQLTYPEIDEESINDQPSESHETIKSNHYPPDGNTSDDDLEEVHFSVDAKINDCDLSDKSDDADLGLQHLNVLFDPDDNPNEESGEDQVDSESNATTGEEVENENLEAQPDITIEDEVEDDNLEMQAEEAEAAAEVEDGDLEEQIAVKVHPQRVRKPPDWLKSGDYQTDLSDL